MAIYGIATTNLTGCSVTGRDLEAMRSCLAPHMAPADRLVLPHVGVGSVAVVPSAAFSSYEHLLVACDSDLYSPVISSETSAAEAIARLYRSEGPLFLHKLSGAFALAIWDVKTGTLMLAVDRFGIKRLCYARTDSEIIFATRPSAIFASNRVQKNVDLSAITEYLVYNVVPIPRTAFAGIARVAPGEYVLWTEKGATKTRYWDMRYPENDRRPNHALSEELLSRMEAAAVQVTSADLNLSTTGCFLSGGTDSSSILGLLTRLYSARVNAFSIGFSEDRFNELQYAHLAAKHFQAQHFEDKLGPVEARKAVAYDKIVFLPTMSPLETPRQFPLTGAQSRSGTRGWRCLLAGDGGDELFGGKRAISRGADFRFLPNGSRTPLADG